VLRRKLADAVGIDRLPKPQARNVRTVGTIDRGEYVIEKLVYETFPDCQVAAHLYRPAKVEGKLPAILFPPGHSWLEGKSHPDTQAFGITMARWGFIVLVYDPHGEGERGVSMRDHRRTELLLAGLSQQAVPTFESKCALEYLLARKDVDPARIGMTGESGGGYNTWVLTSLEPRIAVAVPVVGTAEFLEQVQAVRPTDYYLGREHCHYVAGLLRFANNHEYVAMVAPRPVLVISAHNDHSFRIPGIRQVVGYGRELYKALGKPDQIGYFEDAKLGHGYQKPKREAAYGWFRRWLQQHGSGEPIPEPEVKTLPHDAAELRCFLLGANQPAGPGIISQVNRLVADLPVGQEPPKPEMLRQTLREALGIPPMNREGEAPAEPKPIQRRIEGGALIERLEWHMPDGIPIPALRVGPPGAVNGVVLAVADGGKESLLHHAGIRAAVEAGLTVVAIDVRGTGELAMKKPGFVFATSLLLGENFVGRQALDLLASRRTLAALPEFKGKPIGLVGVGPYMAQAATYAAALDEQFAWLVADGGFVSFRSFLDRPKSLRASYRLSPSFAAAWDGIDDEIPASLFVFDVLRRLDLPDLLSSVAPRPVLVVRPINGEREALTADAAVALLRAGRYRWPAAPPVAAGTEADKQLCEFFTKLMGKKGP
jgi:dienelactone hydrolase